MAVKLIEYTPGYIDYRPDLIFIYSLEVHVQEYFVIHGKSLEKTLNKYHRVFNDHF